jgi:hypothetical protein
VYSQEEKWEKPAGGIENAQVVIEKDKVINLRPVSRRFRSIQIEVPKPQSLTVDYSLTPTVDTLASLQVIVRPRTMRDQPLEKTYGLLAKVGYGNYRSPFLLINAGNKRSDEYQYNVQFNHFSSGKGAVNEAPYYSTRFGLGGTLFLNNATIQGGFNYHNQAYRIYGYDPSEYPNITDTDYLKQKLNVLSVNLGIADNNLKDDTDQALDLNFGMLKNNHFDQEILFKAKYDLSWNLAQDWSFTMPVRYRLASQNRADNTKISRHLASLQPAVSYLWDAFQFTVGFNGFYQQDPADNLDARFLIYPNLGVNFAISSMHSLSLKINGEVEQVSQHRMYEENLYLDTLISANNNIKDFNAVAALQGNFSETFGYHLSYNFSHYKRLMFYDNNPLDTARFIVLLDNSGVTRNRFSGQVSYTRNENMSFRTGASYNVYSTSDVAEAWHKPQLELDFGARIRIIEKLHLRLDYSLLTGIKARESSGQVITLKPVNDLNAGFDLELTESAGLFLEFRNIIGQNYQLYNNYPVNGFQFLGGFSIRF